VFWASAGLVREAGRLPTSSRYQYPSAVFLLLILAETLRGVRLPKAALVAAALVTGLALSGGIPLLHREYEERWRPTGESLRTSLGALDIAGRSSLPAFPVSFAPKPTVAVRHYLAATDDFGSPGYDEASLEDRPEEEREAADLTLARALDLRLTPSPDARGVDCPTLHTDGGDATGVSLPHGTYLLANETPHDIEILLRRFSSEPSVSLGLLPANGNAALEIPADRSSRSWRLTPTGDAVVGLCTGGSKTHR
jgi:hypothetical protein